MWARLKGPRRPGGNHVSILHITEPRGVVGQGSGGVSPGTKSAGLASRQHPPSSLAKVRQAEWQPVRQARWRPRAIRPEAKRPGSGPRHGYARTNAPVGALVRSLVRYVSSTVTRVVPPSACGNVYVPGASCSAMSANAATCGDANSPCSPIATVPITHVTSNDSIGRTLRDSIGLAIRVSSPRSFEVWGERPVRTLSPVRLALLVRGGILRFERCERLGRLLFVQHPRRTLRLDRTRERSAKVCANDLPANSERVGDLLRTVSLGCHCVTSPRSFVRVHSVNCTRVRTFACKAFVNSFERAETHMPPPCHPPRGRN